MDRFFGQLDNRTWLNMPAGSDMVRESSYGRAQRFTLSVVVSIDHYDRLLDTRVHDKLTNAAKLFGIQRKFRRALRANHAVDVEPAVHDPHLHQSIHPSILQQVIDIGFADAGADTCHHLVVQTILKAFHRLTEDIIATTALIADDLRPFDTDQWGYVPQLPQSFCDFVGDEVAVGENLEVRVRMSRQNVEQFFMHEGLATQDTKEGVPHLLGFGQRFIHGCEVDFGLLACNVNPTALATKIASVDNGDVQKRREELPAFQS